MNNSKEHITKEQAFTIAEKLLLHIFSEDVILCAKVITASADRNAAYICGCLNEITGFCDKLKKEIKGD